MSKVILLDLDGVLVDFVEGVCRLFGQDVAALLARWPAGDCYSFWHLLDGNLTSRDVWAEINRAGDDFWNGLQLYPHASALLAHCERHADAVYFCSAGNPRRITWLERWLGKRVTNYFFCHDKHLLAAPGRLLIDDHDETVEKFRAAGGDAILYPQLWNRRHAEAGDRAAKLVMDEVGSWVAE